MECDHVADQLTTAAAYQRGCDVVAHRQHEYQQSASTDTRNRLREEDLPEGREGIGAQRLRRSHLGDRNGLHDTVKGQHHERQQDLTHCDQCAGLVVDHLYTAVIIDDTDPDQDVVDHPLRLQQHDPRRRAHQQ